MSIQIFNKKCASGRRYLIKPHSTIDQSPKYLNENRYDFIIKTSESIGTLNSMEDCTQRSFIIKDNTHHPTQFYKKQSLSSQKKLEDKCNQIKNKDYSFQHHLKFLCESDRFEEKHVSRFSVESKQHKGQKNHSNEKHILKPTQTPFFSKFIKEDISSSSVQKCHEETMGQTDYSKKDDFNKVYENQQIITLEDEDDNRCLYEEDPQDYDEKEKQYQSQRCCQASLQKQTKHFALKYRFLLQKINHLEEFNEKLEETNLLSEMKSIQNQNKIASLEMLNQNIKHFNQSLEQEKEQVQALLKEVLFKNQLEKYNQNKSSTQNTVKNTPRALENKIINKQMKSNSILNHLHLKIEKI